MSTLSVEDLVKIRHKSIECSSYRIYETGQVVNSFTGRQLKPAKHDRGYLYFDLQINKIQKRFYAHRLVALNFVSGYKEGLVVNHKDGNKTNNLYTNLEWISVKDNCIHAHRTGLGKNGINHYNAKLFIGDSFQIKHLFSIGLNKREVSRLYGVSETLINNVIGGKSYLLDNFSPSITTERVKIKILYPNTPFKIGDVFYASKGSLLHSILKGFPEIFTSLEWWEERRLEEMPEYIKFYLPLPAKYSIGKVLQWIPKRDCMWVSLESNPSQNIVLGTEDSPATQQEYLTFINKSK